MTGGGSARRLAFEAIEIRRFPGFERRGFELGDLSPGINLIHGPQATGKSTLGRVVEGLLWPDTSSWTGCSLSAEARLDGERWQIDAEHARPRFLKDGAPVPGLPVPGGELADRFSLALHELLRAETDPHGAAEAPFARTVARELAGGFDLEDALRELGAQEPAGRPHKLVQAYEEAWEREERARAEQRELAHREEELDRLREEERAARDAARELAEVRAVLAWRGHRERAETEEGLLRDRFPSAMELVTGDEGETLKRLERELAEAEAAVEAAREDLRRAELELGEVDLPEEGVPRAVLSALRERHKTLQELESRMAEAEDALAGFRRRREDARRSLGDLVAEGDPEAGLEAPAPGSVPAGGWRDVVELARKAERLRGRLAHLEAVEEWLGPRDRPEELDRLAESVGHLRRWLRCAWATGRVAVPGVAAALALAALAAFGATAGEPRLWIVAALGAVLALWIAGAALRGHRDRASAAREYRSLGFEPPSRWRPTAVEARLRELEARHARARVEVEKGTRWGDLEAARTRLRTQQQELAKQREELLRESGIGPEVTADLDDAPLAALVQGLCEWREAEAQVREREAVLERRREERRAILTEIAGDLRRYGYSPPKDAAALDGVLDDLQQREERRRRAREELRRLAGEGDDEEAGEGGGALGRAKGRAERLRAERETLFRERGLDPGDGTGLARLLELREEYLEQKRGAQRARWDLERSAAELPEREDLRDRPEADLQTLSAELARRSSREQELSNEIAVIENEVRKAKASHDLEKARARLEEARWDLRRKREEDEGREVARELGRWLREQVSGRRRPVLMERAGALFARITRGRYGLLDPVGEPPTLVAREMESDRNRSLDELSSGVRLQLLLAVRVAFIEAQERDVRIPLVLDETLANSDERSSREIIEAVLELAREGRQVFYLTAQEDEVAKWKAALKEAGDRPGWKEIDLARVRRLQEAGAVPRSGWRPEARRVPPPDGLGQDDYGELLEVPGIDPWEAPGRVHLWHLVEEPEALHRLLEGGFERWGQREALARDGLAAELLGGGEAGERRWRRLRSRGRCLEVLLQGWRRGRGRPVDRGVLVASGAVSETFIDEVSALAENLEGSASALLQALRERRVKGFYTSKMDELEEYLAAEGYLDDREPLDAPGLREVALRELSVEIERGELTLPEVDRLLAALGMG